MRLLPALLMAAAILVAPAAGQELTEEQQGLATEFAINNSIFVIQHEIGHLLIGEFGLPVLGKEEDAADSLATLQLLGAETDEADQALIDSADGWYLSELDAGEEYETSDFYDEHSLSIQRAYQVVCLAVGANPEVFAETATEYEIDEERQESCGFDYSTAANSWSGVLEPHVRAKGQKGGTIVVVYESGGKDYGDIEQLLKDIEFLENAATGVAENYALPRNLTFTAKLCDEENAYYSYDDAGVTFCYEMVALFFRLIEEDMLSSKT
jgi:hypothetical protein